MCRTTRHRRRDTDFRIGGGAQAISLRLPQTGWTSTFCDSPRWTSTFRDSPVWRCFGWVEGSVHWAHNPCELVFPTPPSVERLVAVLKYTLRNSGRHIQFGKLVCCKHTQLLYKQAISCLEAATFTVSGRETPRGDRVYGFAFTVSPKFTQI